MTEPIWKAWPEECPECGYELEVSSEDTREAWACDGDPVRCPNCGATGHISCSAEEDCYALMYDDQQGHHPAPFQDFSTELRDPWPVVERLRMALREAERYCLGAENTTGHHITALLDHLPTEDD